jgi:hypothetical protein
MFNYLALQFVYTDLVKEFPDQIHPMMQVLQLIPYIWNPKYQNSLSSNLIIKTFFSNCLFRCFDMFNSGLFHCQSHCLSFLFINNNIKFPVVILERSAFLFNYGRWALSYVLYFLQIWTKFMSWEKEQWLFLKKRHLLVSSKITHYCFPI